MSDIYTPDLPAPESLPDNREAWLNALALRFRPMFDAAGAPLPGNLRITCGWPSKSALARKSQRIGECWDGSASKSASAEIFISPILDSAMQVADVLAHELIHAAVGCKVGHKGPFAKVAKAIGLEGKMTATVGGEMFKRHVEPIIAALGPYPHRQLSGSNGQKKQSTRLLKVECEECGYVVRTTAKWLDEVGPTHCPNHGEMTVAG